MSKGAVQIAHELAQGAERARLAGDTVASLAMATKAAEYLQLARILEDALERTEQESAKPGAKLLSAPCRDRRKPI